VPGEIRTGTSSWTSEAWWGRIYPESTVPSDRLSLYSRLFDCVEVDATYYTMPSRHMVEGWYARTPAEFLFSVKMFRELLDPKRPLDREKLSGFVQSAQVLHEKLDSVLLQFPPWVKPGRSSAFLWELLTSLPPGPTYAVELRDQGWYHGEIWTRLEKELRDRRIILAWSYLTYLEIPPVLTADEVYLRFIGDHTSIPEESHGTVRVDRGKETKLWAERLRAVSSDLRRAMVFFNNHFAGFAPESVNIFRELVGLPSIPYGRFVSGSRPSSERGTARPKDVQRPARRLDEFS